MGTQFNSLKIHIYNRNIFFFKIQGPESIYEISCHADLTFGSFQEFQDIGQNLFFCYKSCISCGKSESKNFIS